MSQLVAQHYQFPLVVQSKYVYAGVLASARVNCRFQGTKACSIQNSDPRRRSANYQRNIYVSDFFASLQSNYKESGYNEVFQGQKKMVKELLVDDTMDLITKLQLIDNLQRLGIGYHFEEEIKRALCLLPINGGSFTGNDLHLVALYFRLLRQHGYEVSQDVFNCFLEEKGNFRRDLCNDVKVTLSLYEACHLGFEEEYVLVEARQFTTKHLVKYLNEENINPSLADEVARSLEVPLHWRVRLSEARYFIDVYQKENKKNRAILELAVVDFNILQGTYQNELCHLSRWWKQLGLSEKMSFARDRLVESFLASASAAYKPHYQCCREWTTKAICFTLVLDDMYDIYSPLEELELFTTAVESWDLSAVEQLPDYMKVSFLALLNTNNDIVYMIHKDHNLHILTHLKKVWVDFCKAMLTEARWSKMGYTPTLDEYLENAWVSSSTTVLLVIAFYTTNQTITHDIMESLNDNPDIIYYSSMILRLCNDLATSTAELERGDVPSAIQCYMHETKTSEQIARNKIKALISQMWKKLNVSIYYTPFDDSFIDIVMNYARGAYSLYQRGDGMGVQDHEAKKRLKEILVKPISISKNE